MNVRNFWSGFSRKGQTTMTEDVFTIDNMFYEMCINPLGVFSHDGSETRDNFDASSAFFSEYCPDGTVNRYNIESNKIPMETKIDRLDKWTALDLIYNYTQSNDIYQNAMLSYDRFATYEVDGKKRVVAWYNRSK